ncbi:hypothetical protein Hanom_Chr10g00966571 [Helianthus anomalus]
MIRHLGSNVFRLLRGAKVPVSMFDCLAYHDAILMTYLVMPCGECINILVTSGYSPYLI